MKIRNHMQRIAPVTLLLTGALLILSPVVNAQEAATGKIAGFIYDGDGETPIQEARVILKNIKDGKEYESEPTGETGAYQMDALPVGTYVAAVRIKSGKVYSTLSVVKITAEKRLIRSFYLTPERPLALLWRNPCGIALILSGTALVGKGIYEIAKEEPREVSPTQL